MKQEPYKNLRYCQRLKESQCFIQADGLQKKIRNMRAVNQLGVIDADNKIREIDSFWKQGWQYDMTHHTYVQPKITMPKFYLQNSNESIPQLEQYYSVLSKFIKKLKIEHEDETNYRIEIANYPEESNQLDGEIAKSSELALKHLLTLFSRITRKMQASFEQSKQISNDLMMQDLDETIKSSLYFLQSICQNVIFSSPQIQETADHLTLKNATTKFMTFMTSELLQNKTTSMKMTVLAVQPLIGQLTYLLHPMCFAIYGLFAHEIVLKDAKKRRGKCYADSPEYPLQMNHELLSPQLETFITIGDNLKVEEERHSKIVFLNLDGYQSEYNLELVRSFPQHLMYVSFPKYSPHHSDETYNRRFHKKIMYYSTKPQSSLLFEPDQSQALTLQREQIIQNPEHYHQNIQTLYQEQGEEVGDMNRNIYVFPVRMDNLKSEKEPPEPYRDIEAYESNFIRFMLRDHLYAEMRKFKPTTVIISYSGRISIDHDHFIEIIQELSKLSSKIMLFPNYTTAIVRDKMTDYFDNYETMPAYDKVYSDIGQHIVHTQQMTKLQQKADEYYEQDGSNPHFVELLDKLAIFLKISSGHYTLTRPYQEESFANKYKNCQIFPYIIHLFESLKIQYDHCKQRLRRDSLEVALKTMQKSIEQHEQELVRCVPVYYQKVFEQVEKLLKAEGSGKMGGKEMLVEEWMERATAREWDQKEIMRMWYRFRTAESLNIANTKYHESHYLQLQTEPSKVQYLNLKTDKMDDLQSLYKLSFCLRDRNTELLKIYKEADFLYHTRQSFKNHKSEFHLILSNVLDLEQGKYEVYAARGKLGKKEQKCFVVPVVFRNREGVIKRDQFVHMVEWNYAESQNYILLYWPQYFDHVEYYLHKMLQKSYNKKLTDLVFICHKQADFDPRNQRVIFHQLTLPEPTNVLPRWGCSVFFIEDQLYFFGGFHDRESSYLDLQNEITTLDLTDFRPADYQPKKLQNLRKQLYCGEAFNGHVREKRTPSSFIRPRMDFQFYDYDQLNLDEDEMPQQGILRVVLIGGYGQDFKTPHSIFINYYYLLRFQRATRRLLSVHKRYIRGKVVPINTKAMIKNRGVFNKVNILDQREGADDKNRKCRIAMSTNEHYFMHRVLYALKDGNLHFKTKANIGLQLYNTCKKDYIQFGQLVGEVRIQREVEPVIVRRIQNNRHNLMVEVKDKIYLFRVMLQRQSGEVALTHQSIVSIDTRKFSVFALINHNTYTSSQTVLTGDSITEPDPMLPDQDQDLNVVLRQIHPFNQALNLHCLIICNHNQVAVLQGLAFQSNTRSQYLIKIKSKASNEVKRQQIKPMTISSEGVDNVKTFFYKKNNEISGYSFITRDDGDLIMVKHQLDVNRVAQGWKEIQIIKNIRFVNAGGRVRVKTLELRLENYNSESIFVKVISGSRGQPERAYYLKLSDLQPDRQNYMVKQIIGPEQFRFKHQQLLPSSYKTEDRCVDYDYFVE